MWRRRATPNVKGSCVVTASIEKFMEDMSAGSKDSRRRVCVCLLLPHMNGMTLFFFPHKKKREKGNHPHFNLA